MENLPGLVGSFVKRRRVDNSSRELYSEESLLPQPDLSYDELWSEAQLFAHAEAGNGAEEPGPSKRKRTFGRLTSTAVQLA